MAKVKSKNGSAESSAESSTVSFETFKKIGSYEQSNLLFKEASCFNGFVNIRKYKITIELIEESSEILAERLQKLWDECDNYHHWTPLRNTAKQIGYELQGSAGSRKKTK